MITSSTMLTFTDRGQLTHVVRDVTVSPGHCSQVLLYKPEPVEIQMAALAVSNAKSKSSVWQMNCSTSLASFKTPLWDFLFLFSSLSLCFTGLSVSSLTYSLTGDTDIEQLGRLPWWQGANFPRHSWLPQWHWPLWKVNCLLQVGYSSHREHRLQHCCCHGDKIQMRWTLLYWLTVGVSSLLLLSEHFVVS